MTISNQIAKHFRQIYFGGNWTCSNYKDTLSDITWIHATTRMPSCNSIAALVYHVNYYIRAVMNVMEGGELDAHDKYSFDLPPVNSKQDWDNLLDNVFRDAEKLAELVDSLPDNKLLEVFTEEKYGSWYRNLHGVIEHAHYHLGQIVVIKKLLQHA